MNKKTLYLIFPKKLGTIAPEIYGHFTEHIGGVIYDGLWVGKDSDIPNVNGFRKEIIDKLQAINAPVIRWPGGCFAEIYDWRDGVGENRPVRSTVWSTFDGSYEPNTVGTHEFMDFCDAVGAKAYFAANLTTATAMDIFRWMDYCLSPRGTTTLALEREKNGHPEPFNIPFWGVGNENWGDGGNMSPEFYSSEARRLATIMDAASHDAELFACGTNCDDFSWTDGLMRDARNYMCHFDGYAMHFYCDNRIMPAGEAVNFTDEEWTKLLKRASYMEDIIVRNWNIISGYGMQKYAKLVVDEWGVWHPDGSGPSKGKNLFEQQSTMRDAMVAALTLNIFNNHCDKVRMANVAQLVNNLHALFLAGGDKCITTPTYHVFDMYKNHQGADAIETVITNNDEFESSISVSASEKGGKTLITIGNFSLTDDVEISLECVGTSIPATATATILYNEDIHAHNTFENPDCVVPVTQIIDLTKSITVPKSGIMSIEF